jgi:hypothetical protein
MLVLLMGLMNYAFEMGLRVMINIQDLIKIGLGIETLAGGTHIQTRRHPDMNVIS